MWTLGPVFVDSQASVAGQSLAMLVCLTGRGFRVEGRRTRWGKRIFCVENVEENVQTLSGFFLFFFHQTFTERFFSDLFHIVIIIDKSQKLGKEDRDAAKSGVTSLRV